MNHLLESSGKTIRNSSISEVRVHNFRNLSTQSVALSDGTNLFVGANGQGKSNFLEAVHLVSTTRSFRRAKDKAMIRTGAEQASVTVLDKLNGGEFEIQIPQFGKRKAFISGTSLPNVQSLVGRFPSVCFSTADLLLVTGEPADRRRYLDLEISQLSPKYLLAFSQHKKALEQRNAYLKEIRDEKASTSGLDIWDAHVAKNSAIIRELRIEFLLQLAPIASEIHFELSGKKERLRISYEASDACSSESDFMNHLRENRNSDIATGFTTSGPQRDDFGVSIDGNSAKAYSSQGQQRTASLSLRLGQVSYLRDNLNILPLLLLDDIFSDLDPERKAKILKWIDQTCQTIITCTDLNSIDAELIANSKIFEVKDGVIL